MSANTVLFLQSMLITLQTINAAIATLTHSPVISVCISAFVGGFQYYVQHVGNGTTPVVMTGKVSIDTVNVQPDVNNNKKSQ